MVIGLPQVKFLEGVCPGCEAGKHPKEKYDKGKSWKVTIVLELVHSDVVGPFPVPSFGKARYVLTFIDEFSRYTWVFFLTHKSEVFDKFIIFKDQVEKKLGKAIKILRIDNGREYVNSKLIYFCTHEGIDLQNLVAYIP